MALYGKLSKSEFVRTILDDGFYKASLLSVEDKVEENIFDKDENGAPKMRDVFLWTFETEQAGDDGRPVRLFYRTSQKYGHDKSSLTIFLNGALGRRLTDAEFEAFDLQSMEGMTYTLLVEKYVGKDGKERNKVTKVKHTGQPLAPVEVIPSYGQDIPASSEDVFEEPEVAVPAPPPAKRTRK